MTQDEGRGGTWTRVPLHGFPNDWKQGRYLEKSTKNTISFCIQQCEVWPPTKCTTFIWSGLAWDAKGRHLFRSSQNDYHWYRSNSWCHEWFDNDIAKERKQLGSKRVKRLSKRIVILGFGYQTITEWWTQDPFCMWGFWKNDLKENQLLSWGIREWFERESTIIGHTSFNIWKASAPLGYYLWAQMLCNYDNSTRQETSCQVVGKDHPMTTQAQGMITDIHKISVCPTICQCLHFILTTTYYVWRNKFPFKKRLHQHVEIFGNCWHERKNDHVNSQDDTQEARKPCTRRWKWTIH